MDTDQSPGEVVNGQCPLASMLELLGGKWKCIVLWCVMDGPQRFSELRRKMPGVTQKMLTQQLRDLERDGFLTRRVFAEVPPRVEYSATQLTLSLRAVLVAMHDWSSEYILKRTPLQVSVNRVTTDGLPS